MGAGASATPLDALRRDRAAAHDAGDANWNLCWLGSVDADGAPHVRTLVLREPDACFALFFDATSPKWRELERSGRCEVATWFPSLQRQYRLQARPRPMAREMLAHQWANRPRASKTLDWLHARMRPQSRIAPSADWLRERFDALGEELYRDGAEPPMPSNAHAIALDVLGVECLTLDDTSGLHDRRFWIRASDDTWREDALVP